ncbi:MAG: hypothetical protein ACI35Q_08300 [Marinilabiliaceae bacterium]
MNTMLSILAALPAIVLALLVCAIAWLIIRSGKDSDDGNDPRDYDDLL